ncbi:hypothetical protein CesoFtcFv8_022599 [Champsocephalus esox]|uniref:ADAM metallopeptidase domain 15 n=1 Tax=Champsocephalus esox TaxID=159716 RepID=A0AAN8GIV9_9TELE|nr:hypothetical protein CesoFtcFv8_022599 [Champsocephalus esox]
MTGAVTVLLLSAAFTAARSLNAPPDRLTDRRPLLEKTRPFILVDGERRSLAEALQAGHPDALQMELQMRGQHFLFDLQKNRALLPKPPNIFLYLPNGTGESLRPDPVVTASSPSTPRSAWSCSLSRGGGGGEEEGVHLLFSSPPLGGAAGCGSPHTAPPPHSSTHRRRRDILSETKYIELVLVVDHQEFLNYQRNNKTIIYRMLDVANQVDWLYRPLKVRVALTGLEIWSDGDKIPAEESPTDTLNSFLRWRTRTLLPRLRHDNAQLVKGGSFDGTTVGMASQASMCSRDRSGGVNVDHLVSVLGLASTVAHELGHNLGMSHDTAERLCSCSNERRLGGCIMEPSTGFLPGQMFSSCSAADLSLSLLSGGGMCLFNVPQLLLGGAELWKPECEDPCCNASTCRLVPGAQCSSDGICCQDCKLREAGSRCRDPLGECDLPEFCTGSSPYCPPNVFLQNGQRCEDEASYCYEGVCASMKSQCQLLWGPNATSAPPVCFSSVNKQGNKYGNCGKMKNGSYIPCGDADVQCGRIQCVSEPEVSGRVGVRGRGVSRKVQRTRDSDPVKVSLLVLFLFVLPSLLLFVALRFPRLRHSFLSPLHKGRHNRTPVMERADRRNGEQVRPLRFHLNAPPDILPIPPHKEIPLKPLVPVKPRLVAPPPNRHGAAADPAGPKRRPPLRPPGARRVDSSAL